MPTGTPKGYEEENKLQRQEDEKQIRKLLKMRDRDLEPEWETWSMADDAAEEYREAIKRGAPKEELAAIGRKLNTARMLYNEIGGYTCQAEEAKKRLKEILKEMEAENLPAKWAIKRIQNRKMEEAGYKFNGKTRKWYKPKDGTPEETGAT